jgi:hypothetical protein
MKNLQRLTISKRFYFILILSLFLKLVHSQESTYGYVAIGGGGFVVSIIESLTEDNVFYAKTDVGGINRWNESTRTWTPLFGWCSVDQTSFMGTESFAIDPSSPNKIYALAGTNYWNGVVMLVMLCFI